VAGIFAAAAKIFAGILANEVMVMEEKLSQVFHEPEIVKVGRWQVPLRRLTLADWAAIEQRFGSLDKFAAAFNGGNMIQATLFVLYRLVRKVDPTVTEEEVGDQVDDIDEAIRIVNKVLSISVPEEWRVPKGEGETIGGS